MKKCFKLLFTFLMAFCVINTVSAETTYKVEIKDANEGHVYEAYQIFTGSLSKDKKTLSNIVWGNGVLDSFKEENNANQYAKSITNDNAKEKAIELGLNLSTTVAGISGRISNGTYTISGLKPGYYLIKDRNGSQANHDEAYTEYIVKLVGDTEVTPKTGKPTADKKIDEGNGVTNSSKYAIGDTVGYILTGTMPTNYDSYNTYKYIFHDTLSKGLTLDENSVKVYVNGREITNGFTVSANEVTDGTQLDVIFTNTKTVTSITKDSIITVKYNVTVNKNAVRGKNGNPNTLNIEFSNNPYSSETGKTTDIITKVYVFDLFINKIDSETKKALNGAGFTLTRKSDGRTWTIEHLDSNVFKFEGLGVGEYTLTETTTPDGYNTIDPITFTVVPVYDEMTGSLTDLDVTATGYTFTVTLGDEKAELETNIENVKGVELPLTGGMGSIIFTIAGISLMAIAVIGFSRSKVER